MYIDEVTVTGNLAAGNNTTDVSTIQEVQSIRRFDIGTISEHDIDIYPNPASDFITINVEDEIQQIRILNINGQEVYRDDFNGLEEASLDVSKIVKGTYIISVQTTEEVMTRRLIIQR